MPGKVKAYELQSKCVHLEVVIEYVGQYETDGSVVDIGRKMTWRSNWRSWRESCSLSGCRKLLVDRRQNWQRCAWIIFSRRDHFLINFYNLTATLSASPLPVCSLSWTRSNVKTCANSTRERSTSLLTSALRRPVLSAGVWLLSVLLTNSQLQLTDFIQQHESRQKTERQHKKDIHFPIRKYAVKA